VKSKSVRQAVRWVAFGSAEADSRPKQRQTQDNYVWRFT
jgi:hypothetical protein